MNRFLFFSLCDNDFRGPLESALALLLKDHGAEVEAATESELAAWMARAVESFSTLRRLSNAPSAEQRAHTLAYLQRKLKAQKLAHAPTVDHDGGSIALDIVTGYSWTL